MKKFVLIIFLLFIYNCGYTSVYKNLEKQDFKIISIKMVGDRVMNNFIKNEINLYSNKNSLNIYNITVDTKYEKNVLVSRYFVFFSCLRRRISGARQKHL